MPSTSEKQARFMAAAAHSPSFAKRVGISQSVARDFNQADKGSKLLSKAMKHRDDGGAAAGLTDDSTKEEVLRRAREIAENPMFRALRRIHESRKKAQGIDRKEASIDYKFGGGMKMAKLPKMGGLSKLGGFGGFGGVRMKFPKFGKFKPMAAGGGLVNTDVPGRTDQHNVLVPPGSYVITADNVAALGESNTIAGAKKLDEMFGPGSRYGARLSIPKFAGGGGVEAVPVQLAGGEYVIPPGIVKRIGSGSLEDGHDILDKFQLDVRAKNIKRLKGLRPPKGADEA